MSIAEMLEQRITPWLNSNQAEQPILLISHSEAHIEELCSHAIRITVPGASAEAGNHPDAITVRAQEDKKHISVDDIKALKSHLATKPSSGKRIVCIPKAETMLSDSANMLLKTLEESPASTRFLLGAPARRSVLITILSRCIVMPLAPDTEHTEKNINVTELLKTYSAIRISGPYDEDELADIATLIREYASQMRATPQLAQVAVRLKEYYKTSKTPGANIKLASDILLSSLAELQNSTTL